MFAQDTKNTHLEGKVWHRAVPVAKDASSEHVLLPGKDLLRKIWPTSSHNGYVHTRVTGSTGLSVNATQWDEFSKWQAFLPKGRKTCFKILNSRERSTSSDSFVALSSKQWFKQISCIVGMWLPPRPFSSWHIPEPYQVLLPALKAMQYQLHLQLLFPPPTFPSAQSNQYFPLHFSSGRFSLDFPPYACGSCAKIDPRNAMTHSFHWYSALPHVRLRASLHVKFSPKWNQVQVYRR